jgi:hypothetical protein
MSLLLTPSWLRQIEAERGVVAIPARLGVVAAQRKGRALGVFRQPNMARIHDNSDFATGAGTCGCFELVGVELSEMVEREREGYEDGVRSRPGAGQDATVAYHILRPEGKASSNGLGARIDGHEGHPWKEKEGRSEEYAFRFVACRAA